MKFPYMQKDLLPEDNFIRMCEKKGYKINNQFLSYLKNKSLLGPVTKREDIYYYSKQQFYVIQYIKDYRYSSFVQESQKLEMKTYKNNQNWFTEEKTKNECKEEFINLFVASLESFDETFKSIQSKYVNFFALYYKINTYCDKFKSFIELHKDKIPSEYKSDIGISGRVTAIQNLQHTYWKESPLPITSEEKEIIQWFSNKHLNSNKSYFETLSYMPQAEIKLLGIHRFEIVRDLLSVYHTIEQYEDISGMKLKNIRIDKFSEGGGFHNCTICRGFFIKKRKNHYCCSPECSKEYKNKYKKEMRKHHFEYGK